MLMIGQEFKRSKTLEISTTLQCHAKNVQEVSEGDIQMIEALKEMVNPS